mmetsp:Transcript_14777/g.46223  ORF Transcript_14777/g.46223 Transcript_14777/m.46223 type:complete len:336 (+) Transcript_14777:492-1499(+)
MAHGSKDSRSHKACEELHDDLRHGRAQLQDAPPTRCHSKRHCRIEMGAGDISQRIDQGRQRCSHGPSFGPLLRSRDAVQSLCEDQVEGADELGRDLAGQPVWDVNTPIQLESAGKRHLFRANEPVEARTKEGTGDVVGEVGDTRGREAVATVHQPDAVGDGGVEDCVRDGSPSIAACYGAEANRQSDEAILVADGVVPGRCRAIQVHKAKHGGVHDLDYAHLVPTKWLVRANHNVHLGNLETQRRGTGGTGNLRQAELRSDPGCLAPGQQERDRHGGVEVCPRDVHERVDKGHVHEGVRRYCPSGICTTCIIAQKGHGKQEGANQLDHIGCQILL